MVWHAYMLNPRDFWQDCFRFGQVTSWKTALPWSQIVRLILFHWLQHLQLASQHSAIDSQAWMYNVVTAAKTNFTTKTGLAWDLYNSLLQYTAGRESSDITKKWFSVSCPCCSALCDNIPLVGGEWCGDHICGWIDGLTPSDGGVGRDGTNGWRCDACARIFTRDNVAAEKWKDEATKFLEDGIKMP